MSFKIYLPGDDGEVVITYLRIDDMEVRTYCSPVSFRTHLEPTIASIKYAIKQYLSYPLRRSRPVKIEIGSNKFICIVEKKGSRFLLNGKNITKDGLLNALAKTVYLSTTTQEPMALFNKLYESIDLPANVLYALENRVPYHWYEDYDKIKVSLNVMQISDKECAIEISDNIWANISMKDLNTFMNHYRLGHKRGSWKMLSPAKLWFRLMGEKPTDTQLSLMKEFLKQNRTQDIVEERAEQLLNDMLEQYSDKLKLVVKVNKNDKRERHIYVRGKLADWLLVEGTAKRGYQLVRTFMFIEGVEGTSNTFQDGCWDGPICIDNLNDNSSVGDQFATRAIALMNDNIMLKRVHTLSRRLRDREINQEEIRIDFNAL